MPLTQSDRDDEEDNSGDGKNSDNGSVNFDVEDVTTQKQYQDHIFRNRRQLKELTKFHDYVLSAQGIPVTYNEAMNCEDGTKWKAAMDEKCNPLWRVELGI